MFNKKSCQRQDECSKNKPNKRFTRTELNDIKLTEIMQSSLNKQPKEEDDIILLRTKDLGLSYNPTPIVNWERYLQTELVSYKAKLTNIITNKLVLTNFKFLQLIGEGAFGRVILTVNRETNIFFATKVINKRIIYERNVIRHILNEKLILQSIRFPFTLYLEYFFQNRKNMYFIMPLAIGGDLGKILNDCGGKLTEETAAFYSAQILLALEYLHYMSLIYRDLKPKNVLLDHLGYIKLADFGFCKSLNNHRTFTICGTTEYLAPEILEPNGYNKAIDLWAFGVLIFELCSGRTPFRANDRPKTLTNIRNGRYSCPTYFSELLQDLIWNILQKEENLRYKVSSIKTHNWFRNIFWMPLLNKQIKPPIVPNVAIAIKVNKSLDMEKFSGDTPEEMEEYSKYFETFG